MSKKPSQFLSLHALAAAAKKLEQEKLVLDIVSGVLDGECIASEFVFVPKEGYTSVNQLVSKHTRSWSEA